MNFGRPRPFRSTISLEDQPLVEPQQGCAQHFFRQRFCIQRELSSLLKREAKLVIGEKMPILAKFKSLFPVVDPFKSCWESLRIPQIHAELIKFARTFTPIEQRTRGREVSIFVESIAFRFEEWQTA